MSLSSRLCLGRPRRGAVSWSHCREPTSQVAVFSQDSSELPCAYKLTKGRGSLFFLLDIIMSGVTPVAILWLLAELV